MARPVVVSETRASYAHFLTIPTRWADNDVYGHVNNATYYSYFDTAVNRFLLDNRVLDLERSGVFGVVVETGCRYLKSLAFPDALQEFRVTTSVPNAAQGRSSGAQVSIVTKSGTNAFHGSLYEFHRNTVTTANDWFNNALGRDAQGNERAKRPKLIRNLFGGALGGRIIKDRAFFFFSYEGRRDAAEQSVLRNVPTGISRLFGTIAVSTVESLRRANFTWLPFWLTSMKPTASSRRRTSRKGSGLSRPNLHLGLRKKANC